MNERIYLSSRDIRGAEEQAGLRTVDVWPRPWGADAHALEYRLAELIERSCTVVSLLAPICSPAQQLLPIPNRDSSVNLHPSARRSAGAFA